MERRLFEALSELKALRQRVAEEESSLQKDEFDVPTALSRWVLAQNE